MISVDTDAITNCIRWIWASHAQGHVRRHQVMTQFLLRAQPIPCTQTIICFNTCPAGGNKADDVKATHGP